MTRLEIAARIHAALVATDSYGGAPSVAAKEALDHADALLEAAEKPAEAALEAQLPWVIRHEDGKVIAAFDDEQFACDCADRCNLPPFFRVAAAPTVAAPPVAAVKFDAKGDALLTTGGRAVQAVDGWAAVWSTAHQRIAVFIDLRPGEDAGETVSKMLAPVGRGP